MNLTIIEEHNADGVIWGLSTAGPNPPAEEFLEVPSHAEAVRIKDAVDAGDIMPFLEAAKVVVESDETELVTLYDAEINIRIEQAVFGDDLRVRDGKDFYGALCDMGYSYPIHLQTGIMTVTGPMGGSVWVNLREHFGQNCRFSVITAYDEREGRVYASDLEAVVSDFRRLARPFSQDTPEGWAAMRELIMTMHERSFTFHSGLSRAGMGAYATFEQGRKGLQGAGNAPTLPRAVADAALDAYTN